MVHKTCCLFRIKPHQLVSEIKFWFKNEYNIYMIKFHENVIMILDNEISEMRNINNVL